ncbi:hypothetical protein ACSSVV_001505 [Marinobacter sp. MBR-105]
MRDHSAKAAAVRRGGFRTIVNERECQVEIKDGAICFLRLSGPEALCFIESVAKLKKSRLASTVAADCVAYDYIQRGLQVDFAEHDPSFRVGALSIGI